MVIENLYSNSLKIKSADIRLIEFQDIESSLKNILNKENINCPNISIFINIMQTESVKKFNAHAKILEDGSYEIGFCPQLLTLIDGLSIELTTKYKEHFSVIDKNMFYDKNNRNKLQSYIFEYFINHIFSHELFHILRGHIKYLHENKSLNMILEFEESNEKNLDNLYLEIDADKYASIHSLLGNFEILEKIRKLGFNISQVLYIIFMSMNELFYIVHLLSNKPMIREGHPLLFDRVVLFNHYFMETLDQDKIKNILEKDNISYDAIDRLNTLTMVEFFKKYSLEDLYENSDIIDVTNMYDNFRINTQLDSYSYDIASDSDF